MACLAGAMPDPHPDHRLADAGPRRPGLAHIISTVRPAHTSPVLLLIFHTFDRERPPLHERFARRHTPDVVIELAQN